MTRMALTWTPESACRSDAPAPRHGRLGRRICRGSATWDWREGAAGASRAVSRVVSLGLIGLLVALSFGIPARAELQPVPPNQLVRETCPPATLNFRQPYTLGWTPFPPKPCTFACVENLPTHQSYTTTDWNRTVFAFEILGELDVHGSGPLGSGKFLAFFHERQPSPPPVPCLPRGKEWGLSVDLNVNALVVYYCASCIAGSSSDPANLYRETVVYPTPRDNLRYQLVRADLPPPIGPALVFTAVTYGGMLVAGPTTIPIEPQILPLGTTGVVSIMSLQTEVAGPPPSFLKSSFFVDELSIQSTVLP